MELRLLGPFEAIDGDRSIALPQQKTRALLSYLALHADRWVATDAIVDALWGESPPPTVASSLQNHVSRARKAVGAAVLESRAHGYVLRLEPDRVDALLFERLVAAARAARGVERAAKLRSALALWRGPALADIRFFPFALTEAPRLDELRLGAVEDLVDAELALGRGAELVAELSTLVSEHPLRERLRGQLMLALYRAGRQADALAAYHEARRALVDELGIEPSAGLRELEAAILRQDEALAVPRPEPRAPTEWRRRTVTIVFAEVTVAGAPGDPSAERALVDAALDEVRAASEAYGGTTQAVAGDAAVVVFGVPGAREDDAIRAVRAAAAIREAIADLNTAAARRGLHVELRTGIRTGEVLAGSDETAVSGGPVVVAKRLAERAEPGEILLGPATMPLVRDAVVVESLGPLAIRGRSEPLPAFRLLGVLSAAPAADAIPPLVGRQAELTALRAALETAVRERRARLLALVGEPGIGKSRLARELADSVAGEARVLVARCPSYGAGATYLPLADLVAAAAGERSPEAIAGLLAGEPDAAVVARRIAELVGLRQGPAGGGEAFWAVRKLLEVLARERPLLVVLEDLHGAEPTFLDLVEHVREWTAAPVLVLATARPELLEARPSWAGRALRVDTLGELESHVLLDRLGEEVDDETRARVVATAGGNPLFLEQLQRYAAEAGSGSGSLPPSLEALLASRLDLLPAPERATLDAAAVAGREFWRSALLVLAPEREAGGIGRRLAELQERGLVLPAASVLPGEDGFRFAHALIRDAAYAAIPSATRSELHERLADWLEERAPEQEELAGAHLERAHRDRIAAGRADRHARVLAGDAGAHLGRAGIRAFKRGDVPATVNLLGRATGLLPRDDAYRRELLCELGLALRTAGDLERAASVLEEAITVSEESRDRRVERRGRVELGAVRLHIGPHGRATALVRLIESATPVFEAVGDDRALGRSWLLVGMVRGVFQCRFGEQESAAERSIAHYARAGWPRTYAYGDLATAMFHGPRPVTEALERCYELLSADDTGPAHEAHLSPWAGGLEAMRGDQPAARALIERGRELLRQLGQPVAATYICEYAAAFADLLADDACSAEQRIRAVCEFSEQRRELAHLATAAADLSHVLQRLGDHGDAARWADIARSHAADDDVNAQYKWRSAQAKLSARAGRVREAVELARSAVSIASETDALNDRAAVLLDLADVLRVAGADDEAAEAIVEAVRLYELKGNVVAAARTRALDQRAPVAE